MPHYEVPYNKTKRYNSTCKRISHNMINLHWSGIHLMYPLKRVTFGVYIYRQCLVDSIVKLIYMVYYMMEESVTWDVD